MRFLKISFLTALAAFLLIVPGVAALPVPPHGTISGQVTDQSGNGMAGVTIALVGDRTGTQIAHTDANGNYALNYGANTQLTVIASKSGYLFSPLSAGFISNVVLRGNWNANFTATFFPIPLFSSPVLLTDENSLRALALDLITRMRDPFPVLTSNNLSSDRRSRIVLFAVNVELSQGQSVSSITAQAEDALHQTYSLPVESIARVPGRDWLKQITVRLPDGIRNAGEVWVSINLHGATSNKVLVKIAP